jgi:LytS/YehU family sensor histidine kinase
VLEEVECLKEYLDLEKMRLDGKFDYEINIDSLVDIEKKNILPMIIQPLVENSIWHGIAPLERKGHISIHFKMEDSNVLCVVTDNGLGIGNANQGKRKSQNNLSLAMKNVSDRLKIMSELNNSVWAVKTEDRSVLNPNDSGTIVTVIFPSINAK